MKIMVSQRGGDRHNLPLYKEALEAFIKYLLPVKFQKNLKVKLILAKNSDSVYLTGDQGQARFVKDKQHDIIIAVDRTLTFDEILITLAHEAVHLKQFVTGKLKQVDVDDSTVDCEWYWKDKYYGTNVYEASKNTDGQFLDLPWEAEAVRLEKKLAKRFMIEKMA
jgi:hypothetical protein